MLYNSDDLKFLALAITNNETEERDNWVYQID